MSWEHTGVRAHPETRWKNTVTILLHMTAPNMMLKYRVPFTLSGSVGPLHSDRQYDISASKEGFVLSPVEGAQGDFKAFALAGVTFMVHLVVHVELATRFVSLKRSITDIRRLSPRTGSPSLVSSCL